jgi:hypothetical protein
VDLEALQESEHPKVLSMSVSHTWEFNI